MKAIYMNVFVLNRARTKEGRRFVTWKQLLSCGRRSTLSAEISGLCSNLMDDKVVLEYLTTLCLHCYWCWAKSLILRMQSSKNEKVILFFYFWWEIGDDNLATSDQNKSITYVYMIYEWMTGTNHCNYICYP